RFSRDWSSDVCSSDLDGRAPFRAVSFFRHAERAGVESVPLVALVSFFLGLTMALLTGYQLQRFGTERLIPGLVSIAFTRELGPRSEERRVGKERWRWQ